MLMTRNRHIESFAPIFLLLALLVGIKACSTFTRSSKVNISENYVISNERPNVEIRVWMLADSIGLVYAAIPRAEVLFASSVLSSESKMNWGLFKGYNSLNPVDTGTFHPRHSFDDAKNIVFLDTVRFMKRGVYSLQVAIEKPGGKRYDYIKYLDIEDWGSVNQVLPTLNDGSILFQNHVKRHDTVQLYYSPALNTSRKKVLYYRDQAGLAPPPFATSTKQQKWGKADSVFYIDNNLVAHKQGIYHVLFDTIQNQGLALMVYEPSYPYIASAFQMIVSARYLMTAREYRQCMESANKKEAIDAFWLEVCGNTHRARNQMASYYHRVEQANQLFAAETEGWKSDRGMIYIVFGTPDLVYRSDDSETWMYGEIGFSRSLTLVFKRTKSPFTKEQYILERLPTYKDPWYNAVNNWRR